MASARRIESWPLAHSLQSLKTRSNKQAANPAVEQGENWGHEAILSTKIPLPEMQQLSSKHVRFLLPRPGHGVSFRGGAVVPAETAS